MRISTPRLAAALVALASSGLPAWLHAQAASHATIYLKEGGVIQGEIIENDPNGIKVRSLKSGTTFMLKSAWIDSIVQPKVAAAATPAPAPAPVHAAAPAPAPAPASVSTPAIVSSPAPSAVSVPASTPAPVKPAPVEPAPAAQAAPIKPTSVAAVTAAPVASPVLPVEPAPSPAPIVETPVASKPVMTAPVVTAPVVTAPVVDGLEPPPAAAPAEAPPAAATPEKTKTKAPTKAPSFSHWYFGAGGAAPTGDLSDVAGIGYSGMLGYSTGLGSMAQMRIGGAGSYWSASDLDANFYDLTGTLDLLVGKRIPGFIAPYGLVGGVGGTRTASPPPGFTGYSRQPLYGARAGAGLNSRRIFLEVSYNKVWVDGTSSAYVPFVFGFRF